MKVLLTDTCSIRKAALFNRLFYTPPLSDHYELKICETISGELQKQGLHDLTQNIVILKDEDDWNSALDELIDQMPLNIAYDRLPKTQDKTILSTAIVNEINIVTNDGPLLLLSEMASNHFYDPGEKKLGFFDFETIIIEAYKKTLLTDQHLKDFVKRANTEGPTTKKEYNYFFRQFET